MEPELQENILLWNSSEHLKPKLLFINTCYSCLVLLQHLPPSRTAWPGRRPEYACQSETFWLKRLLMDNKLETYSESWIWAFSSVELVSWSPRAPLGMFEDWRAYKTKIHKANIKEAKAVPTLSTAPQTHLLCHNPSVAKTGHVLCRCFSKYFFRINFSKNQKRLFYLLWDNGKLTMHIENKLLLGNLANFLTL